MYPNTFYRVSVKALVHDSDGKILVVKENQDTWSLPGGGLDHGEDPVKGVLRELYEELQIEHAKVDDVACIKTFYLEHKQAWLLWVVYNVTISDTKFTYGEGVTAATFLDTKILAESDDIFERMVYEVSGTYRN
jgi:ADP-ribose pyrophosphatase YjhB (NUDIX family)